MDRISLLPDDVILKILSLVPTKDAVTTSLLSKRWISLWKLVPRLEYEDPSSDTEHLMKASRFVDNFFLLHEAPVLETLNLSLGRNCPLTDIETWIQFAISRGLRKLSIFKHRHGSGPMRFPNSLYTCETLSDLSIQPTVIVDVPSIICFRSLKTLDLIRAKFSSDETVHRLLSGCPVLQKLSVVRRSNDNVKTFTIAVPSLRRLTIVDSSESQILGDDVGFEIKAPFLKRLTIANKRNWRYSSVNMPGLVKADIKLPQGHFDKFKGCLTSAKHLTLCVKPPTDSYTTGVFNRLISLNLCTCSLDWCRLILRHTPRLQVLRFGLHHQVRVGADVDDLSRCCSSYNGDVAWERPSSVPRCLISSLITVEWIDYKGTEAEKKVVTYLLGNTRLLKRMAIRTSPSTDRAEKHKMLLELTSIQRRSSKCQLLFIYV